MKILVAYAVVGWLMYGVWLYEEMTTVGAERRAGKHRLLRWFEYVGALPVVLIVWPWFVWAILRVAIRVVRDDEGDL